MVGSVGNARSGVLFVQRRDGEDHFSECHVSLECAEDGGDVAVFNIEALDPYKQREFSRSVELSQFSSVLLHKSRGGLFIIKLEHNVAGFAPLRLICEDRAEADSWVEELSRAVCCGRTHEELWAAVRSTSSPSSSSSSSLSSSSLLSSPSFLLDQINALENDILRELCCSRRNGRLLLHELCSRPGKQAPLSDLDLEMLQMVLVANPAAARERTSDGLLPLHLLLKECVLAPALAAETARSRESDSRLGAAIELLASEYYDALSEAVPGTGGALPIHLVCSAMLANTAQVLIGLDDPQSRINAFLGENNQLLRTDGLKRCPLHLVMEARAQVRILNSTNVAASASDESKCSESQEFNPGLELCSLLTNIEPDAVLLQDTNGDTAVHLAARYYDEDALSVFIESHGVKCCAWVTNFTGETPITILVKLQHELAVTGKSQEQLSKVERSLLVLRMGAQFASCVMSHSSRESRKSNSDTGSEEFEDSKVEEQFRSDTQQVGLSCC